MALTGLHVMTTLTGSALLALAHAKGRLSAEQAWAAAHIDEDWQIRQWGVDVEAAEPARQALGGDAGRGQVPGAAGPGLTRRRAR